MNYDEIEAIFGKKHHTEYVLYIEQRDTHRVFISCPAGNIFEADNLKFVMLENGIPVLERVN